ncbi:macro domain-containing protein [Chitinophaga sp. 22321]|uniref:Macro domain-containing protein n=1 Tax=Chitinophaga hostae TaxID=2831022 RepID=A0ABS5IVB8_9BACT|nr:macro domain-containing protein [Chitinophaga hostae]MBS0026706.1 macro domain-containing protein [Chitinophaga hostae]
MIHYVTGDATSPIGEGNKVITHVCNDIGAWGKGFVLPLAKKWPQAKATYLASFATNPHPQLGDIQVIAAEPGLWIINMIGQHKITTRYSKEEIPPVRYEAIQKALHQVALFATREKAAVHMPRIGCGLAGGTWDKIEPLLHEAFDKNGIQVYVYDLPV